MLWSRPAGKAGDDHPPSGAPTTQSPFQNQKKGGWNKSKASRSNGAEIHHPQQSRGHDTCRPTTNTLTTATSTYPSP